MSQELKRILIRVTLFSVAIFVIQLIVGGIFSSIYPPPKSKDDLDTFFFVIGIQDYIRVALLLVCAVLIARKMTILKYWKIALALFGIVVLDYHLFFVYDAIDYYWIKGLGAPPEKEGLELLNNLISFDPSPPIYAPIDHITGWQLIRNNHRDEVNASGVFNFLIYGSVSRTIWIGAMVYYFFRKRTRKTQTDLLDE